ncbi:hypothetical protein, partial [Prevotella multiformis]|uniref:hypothetical protein n=1 Tax=Prevotella multiformis TaxID=282402 RepID=UPI003F9EE1C3
MTKIIFFSQKDKAIQKILLQNPSQSIITAYYRLSPPIIAYPPYHRLSSLITACPQQKKGE